MRCFTLNSHTCERQSGGGGVVGGDMTSNLKGWVLLRHWWRCVVFQMSKNGSLREKQFGGGLGIFGPLFFTKLSVEILKSFELCISTNMPNIESLTLQLNATNTPSITNVKNIVWFCSNFFLWGISINFIYIKTKKLHLPLSFFHGLFHKHL